jgi:hypothetical protein
MKNKYVDEGCGTLSGRRTMSEQDDWVIRSSQVVGATAESELMCADNSSH